MKKIKISRAKFENIVYLSLNLINMITFLMIFVASILKAKQGTLADIIQCIYCTIMSFLLVLHEFKAPHWTHIYFGFLNIHRGKGLLMLFLGCLVMCEIAFNIIVAIISFSIGFTFFIVSLTHLPPPNSFLVHWQNRQDFWAEGLDLVPSIQEPPPMMLLPPHPSAWHPLNDKTLTPVDYYFQRQEDVERRKRGYTIVY